MKKILLTLLFILGLSAVASFGQAPAAATVKVGIIAPKASFSQGVDNAQMSAGIRDLIAQTFQGSNVEIVHIEAMLSKAAAQEAKDKQCAYVLQVAVSQKKGGGGFGMFKSARSGLEQRCADGRCGRRRRTDRRFDSIESNFFGGKRVGEHEIEGPIHFRLQLDLDRR